MRQNFSSVIEPILLLNLFLRRQLRVHLNLLKQLCIKVNGEIGFNWFHTCHMKTCFLLPQGRKHKGKNHENNVCTKGKEISSKKYRVSFCNRGMITDSKDVAMSPYSATRFPYK